MRPMFMAQNFLGLIIIHFRTDRQGNSTTWEFILPFRQLQLRYSHLHYVLNISFAGQ